MTETGLRAQTGAADGAAARPAATGQPGTWTGGPDDAALARPTSSGSGVVALACPECGTMATVTLGRRDAQDFCRSCDFPMFWARPERPTGGSDEVGDDARRRLPGASGTTTLATVPCPHCAELNLPGAWLCVRCEGSMVPEPPPPPPPLPMPEPVLVPEPVPEPEPAEPFPLWWLLGMLAIGAAAWTLSTLL